MDYLLDSNIIIYATKPANHFLRKFISENTPFVSALSYLEVLGYHNLDKDEKKYFEIFFNASDLLPLSKEVLDIAVNLRQKQKMTIGDSLIAATSIRYNLTLITRNTKDFSWVKELHIINPFETKL
ncbi:MAG: type II toxin-antitoxin system VapC family toxin [Ignavibacteriaceae bacterium]